ncbi:uncharacterized protein LOC141891808 [Acropora palmata]|uniref:uncharacterized protein LOC141891808 n=1 Tax=Acropora palmata TaxID=6131 RepID=UPI003D9FC120
MFSVMELKTIECFAFFYNEGAKGDDFIQKNKFRCQVDSDTTKSLVKLRNHVREFAALDSTAKELGLGENIAVKLNRGSRISGRQERYTIGTDKQLELEIPSILSGVDKLLITIHPVKLLFVKKVPTIVIGAKTNERIGGVPANIPQKSQKDQKVLSKVLSDEQVQELNEAHFDLCKGKSLRLKKDTQMQSVLTFTQTVKRRGAPEASEAGSSSKVPKPSEDSDVDDSDRETEAMMESVIDWSDEGAESAKSTENESQFEDSSGEETQENVNGLAEEGKSGIDSDFDQDDNTSLQYGVEMADPVCIKLNDLIRRGKIDRSRILYKFLNDVVEIYYNPLHEYDRDVIEFFNTITYLGGR